MKKIILVFTVFIGVSSCTKNEYLPYNCGNKNKPSLSQTSYSVNPGDIITINATPASSNVYVSGPDNLDVPTINGKFFLPIISAKQAGTYGAYAYDQNDCPSDKTNFTVQIANNYNPPCSPVSESFTVQGSTSYVTSTDNDVTYDYSSNYTKVYSSEFFFYNSYSNNFTVKFYEKLKPEVGEVYPVVETSNGLVKKNVVEVWGYDKGDSYKCISGKVYCTGSGSQKTLVLCDLVVDYNIINPSSILTAKVTLP